MQIAHKKNDRGRGLNPGYPRAYRLRRSIRRLYQLLGTLFSVACLGASINFVLNVQGPRVPVAFLAVIFAVLALVGAVIVISTWRIQVTLGPDSLQLRDMFATREVRREDFQGRCLVDRDGGAPSLRLLARPGRGPDLNFPQHLEQDAELSRWLAYLDEQSPAPTASS